MSKKKSISRAKLKAVSQEEKIQKNLLGKSPKVTAKPIMKIINNQQDIKLGQFTQEELDIVQTKIKIRNTHLYIYIYTLPVNSFWLPTKILISHLKNVFLM